MSDDERPIPNEPEPAPKRGQLRSVDPRVPPHDLQAEESLVGAMLLSRDAIDSALAIGVESADFYKPAHGLIFGAVTALHVRDDPSDPVTVADELRRQGVMELVGSPAQLLALQAATPATSSAPRYAAIVLRCARARRVAIAATEVRTAALTGDLDAVTGPAEALVETLAGVGAPVATTWGEVDLVTLLAAGIETVQPTMLPRADGLCLLYPGKVHAFNAESETGKSMLALHLAHERMAAGEHVLYLDFESDAESMLERLQLLGAGDELISERFHYVRPDDPFDIVARTRLVEILKGHRPTLAVIDGVAEVMALNDWSENDNTEIAKFLNALPRLLEREGCTVVMIDHLVKDSESQGRYARGGTHKLAGLSGAAYKLEMVRPFARGRDGLARIVVTKDRPGWVRRAAVRGRRPGAEPVAELKLSSDDAGVMTIEIGMPLEPGQRPEPNGEGWDGPTRCMDRVLELLQGRPHEQMSKSALKVAMKQAGHKFREQIVVEAAERLADDGRIAQGLGPRRAECFWWPPENQIVVERGLDWDPLENWSEDE